ncbi:MAG: 1,2-phenylacetyl-CoA epoxidase, subunit C, partial [uncultured Nocardioidaceae bacterium]
GSHPSARRARRVRRLCRARGGRRGDPLGLRQRLRRPACRGRRVRAARGGRSRAGRLLPDARRRRAGAGPAPRPVVHAGAGAGGGGRARQHRARPGGPDQAALRPRRRRGPLRRADAPPGVTGAAGGPAGVLPRARGVPVRLAGRAAQRRLRGHRRTARGLRRLAAHAAGPAAHLPRSGARRGVGEGRQGGALPPRLRGTLAADVGRRHGGVAAPDRGSAGVPVALRRGAGADRRRQRAAGGRRCRRGPGGGVRGHVGVPAPAAGGGRPPGAHRITRTGSRHPGRTPRRPLAVARVAAGGDAGHRAGPPGGAVV